MRNPRLASRYAKSLVDLSVELDQLEVVYQDMLLLQAACADNRELVVLLRSPVINADKKEKILAAIFSGKISVLTEKFIRLLVQKGREAVLPEITGSFMEQYRQIRHISKVKITTAVPVNDELKQAITDKVRSGKAFENIQLETAVDPGLIGGFILEMNDVLVDASIRRGLHDIKKQFAENIYVPNIR